MLTYSPHVLAFQTKLELLMYSTVDEFSLQQQWQLMHLTLYMLPIVWSK